MFKSFKSRWVVDKTIKCSEIQQTKNQGINDLKQAPRKPSRSQKAFYIQSKHSLAFEELAFEQKKQKGLSAPELAELALELLFEKYQISIE